MRDLGRKLHTNGRHFKHSSPPLRAGQSTCDVICLRDRAEPDYVSIRILDLHATTESDLLLGRVPVPLVHLVDECFQADALCGASCLQASCHEAKSVWPDGMLI
jgi:hypothetical protein